MSQAVGMRTRGFAEPQRPAGMISPDTAVWMTVLAITAVWAAGLVVGLKAAMGVIVAGGFVAALLAVRWPVVGLLGLGALCTVDAMTRVYLMTGGLLRWHTLNYLLLGMAALGFPLLWRRRDPHTRLAIAFAALLLLELLFSPTAAKGVSHVINMLAVFGLLLYFLRAARDDRVWYWLGLIVGTVGAGAGLVYYVTQNSLEYIDTNALGQCPMGAIFIIGLSCAVSERVHRNTTVLMLLAMVNFCWVFLTGSRGAMFTAGCCMVFLFTEIRGIGRRLILLVPAAAVAVIIMASFSSLQEKALARVEKLFDKSRSLDNRTSGRASLIAHAIEVFEEHPFGVGTGGFQSGWAEIQVQSGMAVADNVKIAPAHNAWVKILAENGLPGFVLFGAYIVSFAVVGWRKRQQGLLVIGLLTTICLGVSFMATEFQAKGIWFLAAGATALLHREPS